MIPVPKGRKLIFDTNVYIEAIRVGPTADTYQLLLSTVPRTYLSAVVVQELYAGTFDAFGERLVARFVSQTERTGRIVVPAYRDWKETGRILGTISSQPTSISGGGKSSAPGSKRRRYVRWRLNRG